MTSARPAKTQRYSYIKRVESKLFATSRQLERGAITFRLIAALPLVLVMFSSRERLPYWEYAIGAIVFMFAVNIWLRHANRNSHLSPRTFGPHRLISRHTATAAGVEPCDPRFGPDQKHKRNVARVPTGDPGICVPNQTNRRHRLFHPHHRLVPGSHTNLF
jgi:hypothetical protein